MGQSTSSLQRESQGGAVSVLLNDSELPAAASLAGWGRMPAAAVVVIATAVSLFLISYPFLAHDGYMFSNQDSLLYESSYQASRNFGTLLDLQSFAFGQGF